MEGEKFGAWTVLSKLYRKHDGMYYLCRCECGAEKPVYGKSLTSGRSKSCGCKRVGNVTHGKSKTPEYRVWSSIMERCYNEKQVSYKNYGARGITICDEWRDFENFLRDVGKKPGPEYSIERINNDVGYEPGNVRWATKTEQVINRRKFRNNKTGVVGVYFSTEKNKYIASICVDYKSIYLGEFKSLEGAAEARRQAEKKYRPEQKAVSV